MVQQLMMLIATLEQYMFDGGQQLVFVIRVEWPF
jgi:hypothetical protein